ncbi:helix-turn-helix domain-containing protein [Oscillatoria salina]|uniref:transposase n=1 Tax=Oscillatoria salina TaxID=331517 RepID=UPI0013BA50BF|nr:transposase [Oscillatoria salina]MBZ8182691.1 transposase [Oscillatoria salina IIICB1]NET87478.1 transposase [Kamptonema sp. SIO1D9]
MCPKKLTESDKKEIITLYRNTPETTSTLADRYSVSSSTISRFLKSHLTDEEYEDLIQQKRLARTPTGRMQLAIQKVYEEPVVADSEAEEEKEVKEFETEVSPKPKLRSSVSPPQIRRTIVEEPEEELEPEYFEENGDRSQDRQSHLCEVKALEEMLGEDLADDDDEYDDEDDWEDEEDTEDYEPEPRPRYYTGGISVLPLSEASFPRTCYVVVDRAAELITRPLKDFADLGKIPPEEIQQTTLPVFDNHRVARRFSSRRERVIKVPDGKMLKKVSSYLQAKGITRLLIDGQVYSLSPVRT